jgi:hypothetical protein
MVIQINEEMEIANQVYSSNKLVQDLYWIRLSIEPAF